MSDNRSLVNSFVLGQSESDVSIPGFRIVDFVYGVPKELRNVTSLCKGMLQKKTEMVGELRDMNKSFRLLFNELEYQCRQREDMLDGISFVADSIRCLTEVTTVFLTTLIESSYAIGSKLDESVTVSKFPRTTEGQELLLLAKKALRVDERQLARENLQRALDLCNVDPDAYFMLAQLLMFEGDLKGATRHFELALKFSTDIGDSRAVAALGAFARCHNLAGDYSKAIDLQKRLVGLVEVAAVWESQFVLGTYFALSGDRENALSVVTEVCMSVPDYFLRATTDADLLTIRDQLIEVLGQHVESVYSRISEQYNRTAADFDSARDAEWNHDVREEIELVRETLTRAAALLTEECYIPTMRAQELLPASSELMRMLPELSTARRVFKEASKELSVTQERLDVQNTSAVANRTAFEKRRGTTARRTKYLAHEVGWVINVLVRGVAVICGLGVYFQGARCGLENTVDKIVLSFFVFGLVYCFLVKGPVGWIKDFFDSIGNDLFQCIKEYSWPMEEDFSSWILEMELETKQKRAVVEGASNRLDERMSSVEPLLHHVREHLEMEEGK